MTREQWIAAVKEALKAGPIRFTYERLHIVYRLSFNEKYSTYTLRVEERGRMMLDASYGSSPLEKILEEHPLDRFNSERDLTYYATGNS